MGNDITYIYFKRCEIEGGEVCFQQWKYSNRDCRDINFDYKNVEILKIVGIISGPEAVGTAQNQTSVMFGSRRFQLGQILEPNRTATEQRPNFGSQDL